MIQLQRVRKEEMFSQLCSDSSSPQVLNNVSTQKISKETETFLITKFPDSEKINIKHCLLNDPLATTIRKQGRNFVRGLLNRAGAAIEVTPFLPCSS